MTALWMQRLSMLREKAVEHKSLEKYLLAFEHTWLDFPFGEGTSVYKVGEKDGKNKLFAIIADGSQPLDPGGLSEGDGQEPVLCGQ